MSELDPKPFVCKSEHDEWHGPRLSRFLTPTPREPLGTLTKHFIQPVAIPTSGLTIPRLKAF
ncbi:MAG: hypothetical protein WD738_19410 [Pirellulales bacterium]